MLPTNYTTVMVRFSGYGKQYTYKTHILDFKVGDEAVVDVNGETKVVTVSQVHKSPRLEVNAPYAYKWIICKVDRTTYNRLASMQLEPKKATVRDAIAALPSRLHKAVDFGREYDDEYEADFAAAMDFPDDFGDR